MAFLGEFKHFFKSRTDEKVSREEQRKHQHQIEGKTEYIVILFYI